MFRYVASILIFSILVVAPSRPVNGTHSFCPALAIETTFLCATLVFTISGGGKHEYVVIEWGDGTESWVDCVGAGGPCIGKVSHSYATTGTFTITALALTGCPGGLNAIDAIVIADPTFPLEVSDRGTLWIQPSTPEPIDLARLRRSYVDWGDGTPAEEFLWDDTTEGILIAPRHEYASAGDYTITTHIEYEGAWEESCYERVGVLNVSVGTATPIQSRTWGSIKSQYR